MGKSMKIKPYIALFKDKNKKVLFTHKILAYHINEAREHANNILAGSMQGDCRTVEVYRVYP